MKRQRDPLATLKGVLAVPVQPDPPADRDVFRIKPEHTIFAICVILGLVARFSALSLGYSIDDYGLFPANDTNAVDALNVAQGRFGAVLVGWLFAVLGIQSPRDYVLGAVLSTVALAWLAVTAVQAAGLIRDRPAATLAALIVVLHPYQVEYFTFRYSALFLSLNFGLAAVALKISQATARRTVITTLVLLFGASVSPLIVLLFAGAALFAAMARFATGTDASLKERAVKSIRDSVFLPNVASASIALGLFTALFLAYLHFHNVKTQDTRTELINSSQIPVRIAQMRDSLAAVLFRSEGIFPRGPKLIILTLFLIATLVALAGTLRRRALGATVAIIVNATILPASLLLVAYGAVLPSKVWWPVPRTLIAVVWFWAFIAACSILWLRSFAGQRAASIGVALSGLAVLAMISINDQVLSDQLRLNARDQERMNRIITRLEESADFKNVSKLAIIGGSWAYANTIPTAQGDMNISAIYPSWSKVPLANEVSGYRFEPLYGPGNSDMIKICESSRKWPAPESTHISGRTAVVCMQ